MVKLRSSKPTSWVQFPPPLYIYITLSGLILFTIDRIVRASAYTIARAIFYLPILGYLPFTKSNVITSLQKKYMRSFLVTEVGRAARRR